MTWRDLLIEWPARGFDALWGAYWRVIALLSIACLTTASLALLAWAAGLLP